MRRIFGLMLGAWLLGTLPAAGDTLYGADGAQGTPSHLYVLDPASGAVTATAGEIGFAVTGLAVHPITGVMYGSTGNAGPTNPKSLIVIDKTTGKGTLVGPFTFDPDIDPQAMTDLRDHDVRPRQLRSIALTCLSSPVVAASVAAFGLTARRRRTKLGCAVEVLHRPRRRDTP